MHCKGARACPQTYREMAVVLVVLLCHGIWAVQYGSPLGCLRTSAPQTCLELREGGWFPGASRALICAGPKNDRPKPWNLSSAKIWPTMFVLIFDHDRKLTYCA